MPIPESRASKYLAIGCSMRSISDADLLSDYKVLQKSYSNGSLTGYRTHVYIGSQIECIKRGLIDFSVPPPPAN